MAPFSLVTLSMEAISELNSNIAETRGKNIANFDSYDLNMEQKNIYIKDVEVCGSLYISMLR
jgi:hypothetical protein